MRSLSLFAPFDRPRSTRSRAGRDGHSAFGRPLRVERLEDRWLLSCSVPVTQTIRGVSVTFDQCYEREFNHSGTDYKVHTFYTEASGSTHALADSDDASGDNINAVAMTDEAEAAFRFYLDRNLKFLPPGETTLEVYIADDPRIGGTPTWNSIDVDNQYIDNNDLLRKRLLAYHEMQHLVQYQYTEYLSAGSWSGFFGEGGARAIEDRVDTTVDADTGHLFIPEINGILGSDANRTSDISTLSYPSALWWTWLMDQYRQGPGVDPPVTGGSDLGWNALRDFYLELESQPSNMLGAVSDFISAQGSSFRDDFVDYTLAMYAYRFNPSDDRLGFLDTEINATGGLSGHTVVTGGPAFSTDSPTMNPRSSRYWEFNPANQCEYVSFTFDGRGKPYGFSVMTVDGGNLLERWTSYSTTFTRTVRSSDLDRVLGVVTAFDQPGTVDVGYGCVDPTVAIKDPTSAAYKRVGLADNPRAFLVRLDVDGKYGSPVAGLVKDEFAVTLNKVGGGPDIPATIITSSYVQEDYWLLVQAPDDDAGAESGVFYDLTVDLGTSSSDTQNGAVAYIERVQDVHIVLDHSGSMGGATGKIEAARNAANLLINELSDVDQGGYVAFDTDADLRVPLDVIGSGTQRQDLEDAVAAEVPADWTSIGDGLRTALNDYTANGNPANLASFVLLSDGHENEPEYWSGVKQDIIDSGVAVHTISFGPGANEILMQEIATSVTGGHYYAPDSGSVPINSTLSWRNNLSRVYDNVATQIAGRQRTLTALADSAVGGVATGALDFEDLPLGTRYRVGDSFVTSGVPVTARTFFYGQGTPYNLGFAEVDDQGQAGGSDQDMEVNNVNLDFGFAAPLTGLVLQFGEYGGNLNIDINGDFRNFNSFSQITGTTIGGVDVWVVFLGDRRGFLLLSGEIDSFAIGGQELWIDNVRFLGAEGNLHEIPVDDASDLLAVSIAWQEDTGGAHLTELFDPDGNQVPDARRRVSSYGTNDVWEVPDPQPGVYTLRVKNLPQEYFVSASARTRYELYPFIGTPAGERTQGVEVPILAALIGKGAPILGADVTAVVTNPNSGRQTLRLFDDGSHGDGEPGDGVYANVYTATSLADLVEPDPDLVVEGAEPQAVGSYIVDWLAIKDDIRREAQGSFVIDVGADDDQDGLPNLWEKAHGLDPNDSRDVGLDPDQDGLPNFCEYQLGSDPRNSDTDGGGESDGSEVPYNADIRCMPTDQDPLDPSDDRTGPLSSVVALPEATEDGEPFTRLVIGPPVRGTLRWVDILRRAYDAEGDLAEDWTVLQLRFPGLQFVDQQVKPQWSYEYKVLPHVDSEEFVSTIIDFEDLRLGSNYKVGDTFVASGVPITGRTFFFGGGNPYDFGFAEVEGQQSAGGSGQDMMVNNINLDFGFQTELTSLSMQFGEYGGNLNIDINGQFVNFSNFSAIDGTTIGGVGVSVVPLEQFLGRLDLQGQIESFAIGGQELWIDDIIGVEGGIRVGGQAALSNLVEASTDPYAPAGYVLINGGALTTFSRFVDLTLSADDAFGGHDGAVQHDPIPSTPLDELLMRVSNRSDFGGAGWQPFQPAIGNWDLGPVAPGETATVYAQFLDNNGNFSNVAMDTIALLAPGEVVGRHIFYNNSFWDTPTRLHPDFNDDTAIAPDKVALLPISISGGDGNNPDLDGRATFANYTSYSRGINGVMVDIAHSSSRVTEEDFEFRVGNNNHPATWGPITTAPVVDVRADEGAGESDRVTIIFPDNQIQKQWLQVTVLANEHTRLAENDVFYFGNAIGESGNSAAVGGVSDGDAIVNVQDILATRANPHPFWDPAAIDDPYDFDRNERVDAADILISRANQTWSLTALRLIDPSEGAAAADKESPAHSQRHASHAARMGRQVASVKVAWLYDFEPIGVNNSSSARHRPAERALEELLATGWL